MDEEPAGHRTGPERSQAGPPRTIERLSIDSLEQWHRRQRRRSVGQPRHQMRPAALEPQPAPGIGPQRRLHRREHHHAIGIHPPQFDDAILGHEDQLVAGGALCGRLAGGDTGEHEGHDVSRVAHKHLGLDDAVPKRHSRGESGRQHGRRLATKQRKWTRGRVGVDDPLVTPPPHTPAHTPSLRRADLEDLLRPENLPVALLEGAGNERPQHDRVGTGGPGRCLPVEIVEGDPSLLRGRPSRQRPLEEATNERPVFPLGRSRSGLRRDALGEGPGSAASEVAVDQEEGLGGDSGDGALADGAGGIGVIEGFELRHDERALHEAVDTAAILLERM